ncbi:unnamed protein product [marine sediment metagenome]|uniref:DNA (cytosine-5-)-methyltransferase n=1 Tax=marine sediment metagenome TaxID=412755 RepID=X0ZNB5_9ZZZZ
MKRMLDLCSGLGGASEAFVAAGWEVLRIDNNPLMSGVPHTKIMDIFSFEEWVEDNLANLPKPNLIWFSPPCRDFSTAYGSPRSIAQREGKEWNPSLEILQCGLRIIEMLEPKYWIVENVRGAIKFFEDDLGVPNQIHQAYVLWGKFPGFQPGHFASKAEKDSRHSPIRSNLKAKIPIELSQSLFEAIEYQKSLFDYVA